MRGYGVQVSNGAPAHFHQGGTLADRKDGQAGRWGFRDSSSHWQTGKTVIRAIHSSGPLADIAQMAERLICNQQVMGSIPIVGSIPKGKTQDR